MWMAVGGRAGHRHGGGGRLPREGSLLCLSADTLSAQFVPKPTWTLKKVEPEQQELLCRPADADSRWR